ncbi:hypothetical protein WP1_106 [Pseudomonas phage WP1]
MEPQTISLPEVNMATKAEPGTGSSAASTSSQVSRIRN